MTIYAFGDCEIDAGRYELRRSGAAVRVEPQVLDLLLHLASNPERLVTKPEIFETIWKGRAVSDSALSARISAARRAIGEGGADDGFIRTVFRRGFRFVGAVEVRDTPAPGAAQRHLARVPATHDGRGLPGPAYLVGGFACYSHAWAPAFEGRWVRGSLLMKARSGSPAGMEAEYCETLSDGTILVHTGAVNFSERTLCLDLVDRRADSRVLLSLLSPSPPASALVGVMSGKVFHHPNTEIGVTRMVAVRIPGVEAARLEQSNRYLDPIEDPVSRDLRSLGLPVGGTSPLDSVVADVLNASAGHGFFRVTAADNQAVNVALDRACSNPAPAAVMDR